MPEATEQAKKDFAAALTEWFAGLPKANLDWAEALVAAALDETGGDLTKALDLAKVEHANDPDGSRSLAADEDDEEGEEEPEEG